MNGSPPHRRDAAMTTEEIRAEISRVRRRIDALTRPERVQRRIDDLTRPERVQRRIDVLTRPAPIRDRQLPASEHPIHSMPIANRDQREYFLFYDLFVHGDRRKLTAVAPYYGEDFDFAEYGIDLDHVEIEVAGQRIRGARRDYRLDSWEPSILFDFEHPELPAWIAESPELPVTVHAGPAKRMFWLSTEPPPSHQVALALCVQDENRWLGDYLSYYIDFLGVDHVYLYDNRTRDRQRLKDLLAPYIARGKATYIPWNFEWRNRIDEKQIGQPPQETHTLARFGADRWIGFFDTDEFLHVPDSDIRKLLDAYDPEEVGGIAFSMRWIMYKGERQLPDLSQPFLECVYSREDERPEMRWKLFVSPRRVRFMRFHWIQEDQPTVYRPDIRYYHYCLRPSRFEEGKSDRGLGAGATRDETLRRVWEDYQARPIAPSASSDWAGSVAEHVERSFQNAFRRRSRLSSSALRVPGMIGESTRHFLNNLCAATDVRLLEIGAWQGASSCAFLCANSIRATIVDNWSQFGDKREACLRNIGAFATDSEVTIKEKDCFELEPSELERYNLYYYDGIHGEEAQYRGVVDFYPHLDDVAILIVDDWNWSRVRNGTRRALAEIPATVAYSREIVVPEAPREADGKLVSDPSSWWNGIACFVLERNA